MKDPVDHIERPRLPWRPSSEGSVTECGLDASKTRTVTRLEFLQREKDYGRQRNAILTCMTCCDTARRWGTWEDDPRKALDREIAWELRWRAERGEVRLKDELVAIAALIEAHREEFDAHMVATEQRRDWLKRKAAMASAPKPQRPR